MINYRKYKNILVVGAGSGRDISNAIFITEYLKQAGAKKISLAGFLTPWALHYFDGKIEQPINTKIENSYKVLADGSGEKLNSYFEYLLPKFNRQYRLGLEKIVLFSLHWGYKKLQKSIRLFITKNKFDLVVIVDVGGDILADKAVAKQVFTPLVDFTCLKIFQAIKTIDRLVLVMAPGTDGEINIHNQKRLIKKYQASHWIDIQDYPETFKQCSLVNQKINQVTDSHSGTEKVIREIIDQKKENFLYVKTYKLLGKQYKIKFFVRLDKKISLRVYFFDIERFGNSGLIDDFKSIYEAQASLRVKFCGSEVDMSFVPMEFYDNTCQEGVFSLTPMDRLKGVQRVRVINDGIKLLRQGRLTKILLLKKDKLLIKDFSKLNFLTQRDFFIVKIGR